MRALWRRFSQRRTIANTQNHAATGVSHDAATTQQRALEHSENQPMPTTLGDDPLDLLLSNCSDDSDESDDDVHAESSGRSKPPDRNRSEPLLSSGPSEPYEPQDDMDTEFLELKRLVEVTEASLSLSTSHYRDSYGYSLMMRDLFRPADDNRNAVHSRIIDRVKHINTYLLFRFFDDGVLGERMEAELEKELDNIEYLGINDVEGEIIGWRQLVRHVEEMSFLFMHQIDRRFAERHFAERLFPERYFPETHRIVKPSAERHLMEKNRLQLSLLRRLSRAFKRQGDIVREIVAWRKLINQQLFLSSRAYRDDFDVQVKRDAEKDLLRELLLKLAEAYQQKGDFRMEISVRKLLLKENPPDDRVLINGLADAYKRKGNIDMEIIGWKKLVEKNPLKPLIEMLAEAYKRKGDIDVEIIGWKQFVEQNPLILELLADAYGRKGDANSEIAIRKQLLTTDPSDLLLLEALADAYKRYSNLDQEISIRDQLVKKAPSTRSLLDGLADAYKRKGNLDQEIATRKQLVKETLWDRLSLEGLADAYKRKRDLDQEVAIRTRLVEKNRSDRSLVDALADAYKRNGNIDTEIGGWRRLVEQNKSDQLLMEMLADAYKRKRDLDQEVAIRTLLVEKNPSDRSLVDALTDAYKRKGNIDAEISGWMQFVEQNPSAQLLIETLAVAYTRKGDIDTEIVGWKQLLEINPWKWWFTDKLADAYERKGDIDAEIAGWKELVEKNPSKWSFSNNLADAYKRKGDINIEITGWKELVSKNQSNWWLWGKLADAYERNGEIEEEITIRKQLVQMNPSDRSLSDQLEKTYQRIDKEVDAELASLKPSLSMFDDTQFVTTNLSVRLFNNSDEGLLMSLLKSAEQFFEVVDILPNLQFAIGLDILPHDSTLVEDNMKVHFSGLREMLWIQYTGSQNFDTSFLNDIATRVASIIAPHPVGIFHSGPNAAGLTFHNGVTYLGDDVESDIESPSDTESDPFDMTCAIEHLSDHLSVPPLCDIVSDLNETAVESDMGNLNSTSLQYHTSTDGSNGIAQTPNPSTTATSSDVNASQMGSSDVNNASNDHSLIPMGYESSNNMPSGNDSNNTNGAAQEGTNGHFSSNTNGASQEGTDGHFSSNTNGAAQEGTDGHFSSNTNGAAQEGTDGHRVNDDSEMQYKMFVGVATVRFTPSIKQDLSISFELQISPSRSSKPVACRISLSKVVFAASRMKDIDDSNGATLDHYYVTKEAWIIVTPYDGEVSPPDDTGPRMRDLVYKRTDTNSYQATVTIQGSTTPFTGTASYTNQRQTERPSFVVEAELKGSQSGEDQGYEWRWKPATSTETHLEFSTTNPPTHKVTYNILPNAKTPKAIKVKAKAVFERKSLFQMAQLGLSAKARILKRVQLKHWVMELEATIGTDEDFSKFPTPSKDGSYLAMEMDVSRTPIKWNLKRSAVPGPAAAAMDSPNRVRRV